MWTLILFAHVGMMGSGNSNALTNVPGFQTQQLCIAGGNEAKRLSDSSVKVITYVCVKTQ